MVWYPGFGVSLMVRVNRDSKTKGLMWDSSLWLVILLLVALSSWFFMFYLFGFGLTRWSLGLFGRLWLLMPRPQVVDLGSFGVALGAYFCDLLVVEVESL